MSTMLQLPVRRPITAGNEIVEINNLTMKRSQWQYVVITALLLHLLPANTSVAAKGEDPVLVRIEDREITLSEFEQIYRKNNLEISIADPKEPEEYLEMYINFRLKVKEAKALGLDTTKSFREEYESYRSQLAEHYLADHEVTERLVREAWERMQYDIRASHILLTLDPNALPEDTIEVYNRIMDARERILNGEDFAEVALEVSEESSVRDREASGNQPPRRGTQGDLGYFTVFNMVYPFESAAYNTPVGEVSMPVRTDFGYHIVKVYDKLPAMGNARVAHIMLMTPPGTGQEELKMKEELINHLYERVKGGEDFGELATQYSEDRQSSGRNGEMPSFTVNRIVPEFVEAIHKLNEPGDISPPVKSDFGWHIIKLIEKTPPPGYEEIYDELRMRVERDARSRLKQDVFIGRLKQDYGFREYREALEEFYELVDERIFQGEWEPEGAENLDRALATIGTVEIRQGEFAQFLQDNQRRQNPGNIPYVVNRYYKEFINKSILEYEDSRLEEKHPDFARLAEEYYDGILLFEITDQKVWSKATSDTTGLKKFFEDNRHAYPSEELKDVRGMVIADYQDYLEREWLKALRSRYEIWVDEQLLEQHSF